MKQYNVYGYYSNSEHGSPGRYLETFEIRQQADEFIKDFECVPGRLAWIEDRKVPFRQ